MPRTVKKKKVVVTSKVKKKKPVRAAKKPKTQPFGGGPKDLSKLPPGLAAYWAKKQGKKVPKVKKKEDTVEDKVEVKKKKEVSSGKRAKKEV